MPIILRMDVDRAYENRILHYARVNQELFPALDSLGYLEPCKKPIEDLNERGIKASLFFQPFTVPNKDFARDLLKEGYSIPFIFLIEENLKKGLLEVGEIEEKEEVEEMIDRLRIKGGEADVFRLYKSGSFDAISSDDGKFLETLDALDIPYLTPSALVVHLFKMKGLSKKVTETYINELKEMISDEEYYLAIGEVEE